MVAVTLFELILFLLTAALLLSLAAERVSLPPAVALVVGGMVLALVPYLPAFDLDPDLIMVAFLPPLLMASAYFTVWRDFLADLRPILLLSVGAVLFTTALVGVAAHLVMPSLSWAACFALGAIVSPPDAVAAKAVLQRLALPRRLLTILEGESLVNDASGLVLYRFAVAAALTGTFSAVQAAESFAWLAAGGICVGVLCGLAVLAAARHMSDNRMMIAVSLLTSWASYILAERLHASGVLSTVACGLVIGTREHEVLGAQVRVQAEAVWAIVVFVLEALVFVLIGLALRGVLARKGNDAAALLADLPITIAVIATVVVSRLAWVFPATYLPRVLSRRLRARDPAPRAAVPLIIGWAGMRGVVTLAAALALPVEFAGRDQVLLASFAVILFTVLVQGLTLGPLIVAFRLSSGRSHQAEPMDMHMTRVAVAKASLQALEAIRHPQTGDYQHPRLIDEYRRRVRATTRARDEGDSLYAERVEHFTAALAAVQAGRDALIQLHRTRQIHVSVLRTLEGELDLEELRFKRLVTSQAE